MTTISCSPDRCGAGSSRWSDAAVDVVGAYCDWIGIEPGDRLERREAAPQAAESARCRVRRPRRRAPFISSSPLLRASGFDAVGGFDEDLSRAEDVDMWLRLDPRRLPLRLLALCRNRLPALARLVGHRVARRAARLHVAHPPRCRSTARRRCHELPSADRRPLSAAGFELGYAPQILNYLSLLADSDLERAVEHRLPRAVRALPPERSSRRATWRRLTPERQLAGSAAQPPARSPPSSGGSPSSSSASRRRLPPFERGDRRPPRRRPAFADERRRVVDTEGRPHWARQPSSTVP